MTEPTYNLIGVGLYTVPQASRLTGISTQKIRRWMEGYTYSRDGKGYRSAPLWTSDLPPVDRHAGLSFLDLIEARFMDAFRTSGVSWTTLRRAAERAREVFDSGHPFALKRFRTDGRTIFAEIAEDSGEPGLLDLVKSQYAFNRVVSPSLYRDLEFSTEDIVIRWRRSRYVVIDPARAFGKPIVTESGVPTEALARAYAAEGSVERVAQIYEAKPAEVRAAVAFEQDPANPQHARLAA